MYAGRLFMQHVTDFKRMLQFVESAWLAIQNKRAFGVCPFLFQVDLPSPVRRVLGLLNTVGYCWQAVSSL